MTWWIQPLSRLLAEYCVEARRGDQAVILAGLDAVPLVRGLYRELASRGTLPLAIYRDEYAMDLVNRLAPPEVLATPHRLMEHMVKEMDILISIRSGLHTKPLTGLPPERLQAVTTAQGRFTEAFMERDKDPGFRWTATIYPSLSLAQEAGLSPVEFEDLVVEALKLGEADPVEAWRRQAEWQEKIATALGRFDEVRIVAPGTDLTLKVGGRTWINDDGKKNMPGGEVFTGPVEDSVEGHIEFDYPSIWRGVEVEGVRLVFKRGEVVEATARRGEEALRALLSVDEGARRVGELAFGLNYGIRRYTKIILLDEKIGGTMHMALGAGYPSTGSVNRSKIHWDMVKSLEEGVVYGDGDVIYRNGRFIEEVL